MWLFFPKKNLCIFIYFLSTQHENSTKNLFGKVGPIVENEDGKVSKQTTTLHVSNER
jgi:hypothetical protein